MMLDVKQLTRLLRLIDQQHVMLISVIASTTVEYRRWELAMGLDLDLRYCTDQICNFVDLFGPTCQIGSHRIDSEGFRLWDVIQSTSWN